MTPTATIPTLPDAVVRSIADVLGHTTDGLTGSQIAELLDGARIPDVNPTASKSDRLYAALSSRQARDGASNCVVRFITDAMAPVRYRTTPSRFTSLQDQLGEVLVFAGLRINDKGQVARGPAADTLTEAARRASSIRSELRRRGAHELVLAYCLELRADPADLAPADPGAAHRDHQVIDPPGRDSFDVGLHHDRVQRYIDPAARTQQRREERPRTQLRDLHRQVPSGGRDGLVAGAVAAGSPVLGPLVQGSTDVAGRLRINDGLQHPSEQPAHQLTAIGGAEHLDHLEQGRIV